MHYTERMKNEKAEVDAELYSLYAGICHIESYLQSEKFWKDTTVQVADVLHRLSEMRQEALVAKWFAERKEEKENDF